MARLVQLYVEGARDKLHADVLGGEEEEEGVAEQPAAGGMGWLARAVAAAAAAEEEEEDEDEDGFEPLGEGEIRFGLGGGGAARPRESEGDPRQYLFLSMPKFNRDGERVKGSRIMAGQCNLMSQEVMKAAKTSFGKDGLG